MTVARGAELAVPQDSPGADLPGILEPWLWLDQVTPVGTWHAATGDPVMTWVEVRGIVKPADDQHADAEPASQGESYTWAASVRDALMYRAGTAIAAAEGAGYLHERHPEIELGGEVGHYRKEPRKPDILVAKVTVRMTLTRPEWRREDHGHGSGR